MEISTLIIISACVTLFFTAQSCNFKQEIKIVHYESIDAHCNISIRTKIKFRQVDFGVLHLEYITDSVVQPLLQIGRIALGKYGKNLLIIRTIIKEIKLKQLLTKKLQKTVTQIV